MGKVKKLRTRAIKGNQSQHSTDLTEDLAGAEVEKISSKRIKERYHQVCFFVHLLNIFKCPE